MTPRTWAEREVEKRLRDGWSGDAWAMGSGEATDMLLKEHQRAVRIVKQTMKSYNHFLVLADDETLKERWRTRIGVCVDILADLERGRKA